MWKHGKRICCNSLHRSSRGAALIEVVIAIVVLGLIMSSVPPVLILLNNSQFKWNEQTVSESLIRTQIEYIKGMDYNDFINSVVIVGNGTGRHWELGGNKTLDGPDPSYEIKVVVRPIHIDSSTVPPGHSYLLPSGATDSLSELDEGIEEITVGIYHVDMTKPVLSTTNYKYNPNYES
jgi:type II secretory pathway pseudopilin PulG